MPLRRLDDIAHVVGRAVESALSGDPEDDPQGHLLALITLSDLVGSASRVDADPE